MKPYIHVRSCAQEMQKDKPKTIEMSYIQEVERQEGEDWHDKNENIFCRSLTLKAWQGLIYLKNKQAIKPECEGY